MNNRKVTGGLVMSSFAVISVYLLIINNSPDRGMPISQETKVEPSTQTNPTKPATSVAPKPNTNLVEPTIPKTKYIDGIYDINADYWSPSGIDKFTVSIELLDDKIQKVSSKLIASSEMSLYFQEELFAPGINGVVSGKNIDNATLIYAVNGASLHSIAFNEALEKAKKESLRTEHNIAS